MLRYRHKYPLASMCVFFGVSRSGFYCFLKNIGRPEPDALLAQKVAECQSTSKQTYGYRRVWLWLERQGIHRNPKTVLRVMNKYGLLSLTRRTRKWHQMGEYIHKYPNLLDRDFSAMAPNQKWVTDISYIQTPQGTLYLSIIRDLFDLSIVAYKTAKHQSVKLVLDTIHLAMANKKVATELLLHSDQGFQYTSTAYLKLTQAYGITPSMSRRANCYDNAMAENFFSILKSECIYIEQPQSFSQANQLIDHFISFYNALRIQQHGHTPYEIRSMAA